MKGSVPAFACPEFGFTSAVVRDRQHLSWHPTHPKSAGALESRNSSSSQVDHCVGLPATFRKMRLPKRSACCILYKRLASSKRLRDGSSPRPDCHTDTGIVLLNPSALFEFAKYSSNFFVYSRKVERFNRAIAEEAGRLYIPLRSKPISTTATASTRFGA